MNREARKRLQLGGPEKLERKADRVVDGLADLLQAIHLRQVISLPERYLEGKLALHVHFRFSAVDVEGPPRDLCAVFQRDSGLVQRLRSADVFDPDIQPVGGLQSARRRT
jgi:hypothetical protein